MRLGHRLHLFQYTIAAEVQAKVICQHQTKGLIANQGAAGKHRITEAAHGTLTGIAEGAGFREFTYLPQRRLFRRACNLMLELVIGIKMIF